MNAWDQAALETVGITHGPSRTLSVKGLTAPKTISSSSLLKIKGLDLKWSSILIGRNKYKLCLQGARDFTGSQAIVFGIVNQDLAEDLLGGAVRIEQYNVFVDTHGEVFWESSPMANAYKHIKLEAIEVHDVELISRGLSSAVWRHEFVATRGTYEGYGQPYPISGGGVGSAGGGGSSNSSACQSCLTEVNQTIQSSLVPVANSIRELDLRVAAARSGVETNRGLIAGHETRITYLEEHGGGGGGGGGGDFDPDDLELTGTTSMETVSISGDIIQTGGLGSVTRLIVSGIFTGNDSTPIERAVCNCSDATLTYYVSAVILFMGDNGSGGQKTRDVMTFKCLIRGGTSSTEVSYVIDDLDLSVNGNQIVLAEDSDGPLKVNGSGSLLFRFTTVGSAGVTYKYQGFVDTSNMRWS